MPKKKATRRPKGTGCKFYWEDRHAWYGRWRLHGKTTTRKLAKGDQDCERTREKADRILGRVADYVEDGAELLAAVRAARHEPDPRDDELTVAELAERWLDYLKQNGQRSPENLAGERSKSRYLTKAKIGKKYVRDVTDEDAARWADDILKGRSGKTVNRALATRSGRSSGTPRHESTRPPSTTPSWPTSGADARGNSAPSSRWPPSRVPGRGNSWACAGRRWTSTPAT
ncbi:MAG: hypothetical protein ACYTGV_09750 [Planctomycetota bacterium]|jgi:hypothetical protein